jgi:hypothetical protein
LLKSIWQPLILLDRYEEAFGLRGLKLRCGV